MAFTDDPRRQGWKLLRTDTLPFAGDPDFAADQTTPDDVAPLGYEWPDRQTSTTGVAVVLVLRDAAGNPVARGAMTYEFTPIETYLHPPTSESYVVEGFTQAGVLPYEKIVLGGINGTNGGGFAVRLVNFLAVPGAAAEARFFYKEL